MNLWQTFLEALVSLTSNKMRSALTVLGIVIGVAAVVSMLAIGTGAESSITSQIDSIGTNMLYVRRGGEAARPEALTLGDAEAIANPELAPSVGVVAPIIMGQVSVSTAGASTNTSLTGITPAYFQTQDLVVAEGVLINQEHMDTYDNVVMLGVDVAETLFDTTNGLIGESVRINGQIFKVIGVLEEQGGTSFGSQDDVLLAPLTTTGARILPQKDKDQVSQIFVQAVDADSVEAAIEEVSNILRSRHRSTLGVDDFTISSTQSMLDMAATITGTMTLFLGGVAGISLLVGGIGIMNIMLVTVVERTREIGLRKAMGARKNNILVQFLVESSLLSLIGGLLGILAAWGIAVLVGQLASSSSIELNPIIELDAVLLATIFSAAVGLFFGLYPANRAANLEPVEALRSE